MTINGTNAYTDEEVGDGFTGAYTRTKTGADDYTMVETGTKTGGSYSQTITGEDDYTLEDVGDNGTGHYTRTITGGGSYDRTTTGAGATLPTDADDYSFTWEQTGDPHSGVFTLSQAGSTRYDLLEDFVDISNTTAAQSAGHMNVYPFGQTFVDPYFLIVLAGAAGGFLFFGTPQAAQAPTRRDEFIRPPQFDLGPAVFVGIPVGGAFGLGGAAMMGGGAAGMAGARIIFGQGVGHGARHLAGTGLSQTVVELAIQAHVRATVVGTAGTAWYGWVQVNGQWIQYRAHVLANGTINVGTYFPVSGNLRRR